MNDVVTPADVGEALAEQLVADPILVDEGAMATLLGIGVRHLRDLTHQGIVPVVRLGLRHLPA